MRRLDGIPESMDMSLSQLYFTLEEVARPDLECGVSPLGPPAPMQLLLLGRGVAPLDHQP